MYMDIVKLYRGAHYFLCMRFCETTEEMRMYCDLDGLITRPYR